MFMGLGQVLNETQESQIILSTLRERLWCSADQRTGGNLDREFWLCNTHNMKCTQIPYKSSVTRKILV